MKKISIILALAAFLFTDAVLAASAVVTSLTGTVNLQTGAAAPRVLRQGDEVVQGDTVFTGAASSVVLKFDDGQVAALTANSRMQVTAYAFNPQAKTGNIFLSLVVGGMRAITGLIGHNQPDSVKFRAATATIGIRGSDGMIVTDGTSVVVTVTEGAFTFTFAGETIVIPAGRGAFGADNKVSQGTAQQVFNQLPPAFQSAIGGLTGLTTQVNQAAASNKNNNNNNNNPGENNPPPPPPPTPGPNNPGGNTGGGSASSK
jgi:FecR protein